MNTESGIPITSLYADEAPSGYIEPPTNTQFHSGVEPEMTLPAAWWNYFVNLFTNTNIKTKEDITAILAELNNVLTTMGITPDSEESNQLATLFHASLGGKAPVDHASSATTYGVASEASYGHAKASTVAGSANGTASKGTTPTVFAQSNHVHPLQTSVSGNAGKAGKANVRVSLRHGDTWFAKTFAGLSDSVGYNKWTDGENIYYSNTTKQLVLNKATSTWVAKTWTGLTDSYGTHIWTDGDNIYHGDGTNQYVLNKATSTWAVKTWIGLTSFNGINIWTDGENIYHSGGTSQFVLNKTTSTWVGKTLTGLTSFNGSYIWTDGENIYYSNGTNQFVLPATRHNYVDDAKYNSLFGIVTKCNCSTLSDRFVFGNE